MALLLQQVPMSLLYVQGMLSAVRREERLQGYPVLFIDMLLGGMDG